MPGRAAELWRQWTRRQGWWPGRFPALTIGAQAGTAGGVTRGVKDPAGRSTLCSPSDQQRLMSTDFAQQAWVWAGAETFQELRG